MKKIEIRRHVATKIILLLLSGYIFVTIVLTSLYMTNQYNEIKQRGFDNQKMLLIALGPSLGQVTFDGDLDQLESLLQGIIESPSIAGIAYSDITKTMNVKLGFIPDYNLIDYQENIAKTSFYNISQFQVDSLFGLSGNIIHNNSIVGNIIISSSQTVIFMELRSAILTIIFGMLIQTFLLWLFFRWVSMVYLHHRLTDIINGLNRLEPVTGKFTPLRVDTKEQDEIWAIQKSFNRMAEKLQMSHNKLRAYNKELEEKVHERTAQLEKISITDRLTGLCNRHKLDSVLENEFKRSNRFGSIFSLILIDIDDFKSVNDMYGHQIGDKVLIEISNLLLSRTTDITGRWGGEEFLIIIQETGLEGALLVAENIRLKIEKHLFPKIGSLTASFGVSTYKQGDTINHLISRTDLALYTSKANGKNQVQYKE
jgi:diguanylate cyclase (GGDEF)-like protein